MDMTRIKDMQNYQGENEGFISLNAAIWKRAVEDEFKKAKHILFGYMLYEIGRINGKEIKKSTVQKAIDMISPELLKTVRQNIYKESQKWPDNGKRGHGYDLYKREIVEIVKKLMKGE